MFTVAVLKPVGRAVISSLPLGPGELDLHPRHLHKYGEKRLVCGGSGFLPGPIGKFLLCVPKSIPRVARLSSCQ